MNITTAKALFRDYVDDPDANFVTDEELSKYLQFGLDEWHNKIRQVAPHLLMETTQFSRATGTNFDAQAAATKPFKYALDLNAPTLQYVNALGAVVVGPYMGPLITPPNSAFGPAAMIMDIYQLNSSDPSRRLRCRPIVDMPTLMNSAYSYNYAMNGYVLQFRGEFPNEFLIEYFPRAVDIYNFGTSASTADTDFVASAKLDNWHELIVLMATKRYMIKDGVANQILLAEYARQVGMFDQYLVQSFNNQSQSRVSVEYLF